ncbi:MAG: hypothetical protein LBU50_05330, partial [Cellulomonas sp.]|nr:hypothetical protein [Cellulomonas sp.]
MSSSSVLAVSGHTGSFAAAPGGGQGLVDVGPLGRAHASSAADQAHGWRPGDAQHAVRPGRLLLSGREVADYAFCTDEGRDEHWEIAFEQPILVDRVVVHDALGARGMGRACLRVEAVRGGVGSTQHLGEVDFGSGPGAFTMPFDGQHVEGVRITLCGSGRLRLFRVEIVGTRPTTDGRYVLCRPRIGGLTDVLNQVGKCYEY